MAFYGCTSLTDVYYTGTKEEWAAIEIGKYNDSLTSAIIHYNSAGGGTIKPTPTPAPTPTAAPTSVSVEISNITVNHTGKATAYFTLKNKSGNILKNKTLSYKLSDGTSGTLTTDDIGVAKVETPALSYANGSEQIFTVTFSGAELEKDQFTIKVNVTPLVFSQKWNAKVTGEAGAKVAFGVNGSVGVLEGEAELASIGASGKAAKTFSVEEAHEANGSRTLSLASSMSYEAASKAKVGIYAKGAALGQNVNVTGGEVSGQSSIGKSVGYKLKLENYNPNDDVQLMKMGYFLLDTATDVTGSNVILRQIMDYWDMKPYNESNQTVTAKLAAGSKFLSVGINDVSADAVGLSASSVQKCGTSINADNELTNFAGVSTVAGGKLCDISYKNKYEKGKSVGTGAALWSKDFLNNDITFSATTKDGKPQNVSVKTLLENNNKSIFWYKENTNQYKNITFTDSDMNTLLKKDKELKLLSQGKQGFYPIRKIPSTIDNMLGDDVNGVYSVKTEKEKGIDASINFGLTAGLGFNFGPGISGIEGREYETEKGQKIGGVFYKTSESNIDSLVEENKNTIEDVLSEPVNVLKKKINGMLESVRNSIKDGIDWVGGKIRGTGDAIISVFKVKGDGKARTYSILSIEDEAALFSTAGESKTVGEPCVISAETPDGTPITSFDGNPLELTLNYTDEDLAAASISSDMVDEIKIYRWSEEKAVYVYVGGDAVDMGVTAKITKPGQYVLAIDTCPPAITEFQSNSNGSNPTITAVVADMSGIGDFEFKLDGETVVDMNNFSEHYNAQTALFSYTAENLSDGKHTAEITAADTRGNALEMPEVMTFDVDTVAPVITSVTTESKNGLTVYAQAEDVNLSGVNVEIVYDEQTYTYPMTLENGVWTVSINKLPAGEMTAEVAAYDSSTNSARTPLFTSGKSIDSDNISYSFAETSDNKKFLICEGVNTTDNEKKLMIASAVYKNGTLVRCGAATDTVISGGGIGCVCEYMDDADSVKVYLWDENMVPITDAFEITE